MSWMLNLLAIYMSAGALSYEVWGNAFIGINTVNIIVNAVCLRTIWRSRR